MNARDIFKTISSINLRYQTFFIPPRGLNAIDFWPYAKNKMAAIKTNLSSEHISSTIPLTNSNFYDVIVCHKEDKWY